MTATATATPVAPPVPPPAGPHPTLSDLLDRLGGVPPGRVLAVPPPGTATEADLLALLDAADKRLCELIDGTLVEKPMGWYESRLAGLIFHRIESFLEQHDLGIALTADGPVRLSPRLFRIPDVSFLGWHHFPGRVVPAGDILDAVPDLAVEVLSPSNTPAEMRKKLGDYFAAGVRLVWFLDPPARSGVAYTAADAGTPVPPGGALDGGGVLPDFRLELAGLFARAVPPAAGPTGDGP